MPPNQAKRTILMNSGGMFPRAKVHGASMPNPKTEIQTVGKMNFNQKVCADDKVRRFTGWNCTAIKQAEEGFAPGQRSS